MTFLIITVYILLLIGSAFASYTSFINIVNKIFEGSLSGTDVAKLFFAIFVLTCSTSAVFLISKELLTY